MISTTIQATVTYPRRHIEQLQNTRATLCSATQGTASYAYQGSRLIAIHWPVICLGKYAFLIFALSFSDVLSTVWFLSLLALTGWNQPTAIDSTLQNAALNQSLCKFILPSLLPRPLILIDISTTARTCMTELPHCQRGTKHLDLYFSTSNYIRDRVFVFKPPELFHTATLPISLHDIGGQSNGGGVISNRRSYDS